MLCNNLHPLLGQTLSSHHNLDKQKTLFQISFHPYPNLPYQTHPYIFDIGGHPNQYPHDFDVFAIEIIKIPIRILNRPIAFLWPIHKFPIPNSMFPEPQTYQQIHYHYGVIISTTHIGNTKVK